MDSPEWSVERFVGAGRVRFGDERASCRRLLGEPSAVFAKGAGVRKDADAFDAIGAHLVFDERERLELVELFFPALVVVDGTPIRPGVDSLVDVVSRLERRGHRVEPADAGANSPTAGVALYAEAGRVEAVSAYRRGYYDRSPILKVDDGT